MIFGGLTAKPAGTASLDIDLYSSPIIAVSLRKISSSYSGNCIRVRRDSDNTSQDIGFTGGLGTWVDDAAISSFIGAGTGYIEGWYDQSGNGYDLQQSTLSYQPKLVADVFGVSGGSANCIQFDATSWNLFVDGTTNVFFASANLTMLIAYRLTTSGFDAMFSCNGAAATTQNYLKYLRYSTAGRFYTNVYNNTLSGSAPTKEEHVVLQYNGSTNSVTIDDGTTDSLSASGVVSKRYFVLGAGGSTGSYAWGGEIAEFIWFDASLTNSEINTMRDDQNATYTLY